MSVEGGKGEREREAISYCNVNGENLPRLGFLFCSIEARAAFDFVVPSSVCVRKCKQIYHYSSVGHEKNDKEKNWDHCMKCIKKLSRHWYWEEHWVYWVECLPSITASKIKIRRVFTILLSMTQVKYSPQSVYSVLEINVWNWPIHSQSESIHAYHFYNFNFRLNAQMIQEHFQVFFHLNRIVFHLSNSEDAHFTVFPCAVLFQQERQQHQ